METIAAVPQESISAARRAAIPHEVLFERCLSPQVKVTLAQLAALVEDTARRTTPPLSLPRLADLTGHCASTLRAHLAILQAYRAAVRLQRQGPGRFTLVLADWLFSPLPDRGVELCARPFPPESLTEPAEPGGKRSEGVSSNGRQPEPLALPAELGEERADSVCRNSTDPEALAALEAPENAPRPELASAARSRINILINNTINEEEEVGPFKKTGKDLPPPPNNNINTVSTEPKTGADASDPRQGGETPGPRQGGETPGPRQGGETPGPRQGDEASSFRQGGETPGLRQGGETPGPRQGGETPGPRQGDEASNQARRKGKGARTSRRSLAGASNPQQGDEASGPRQGDEASGPRQGDEASSQARASHQGSRERHAPRASPFSAKVHQALEASGVFSSLFSEVAAAGWSEEELLALAAWCQSDNPKKPGGLFMVRLRRGLAPPEIYFRPPCSACGKMGGEHTAECTHRYLDGPYASIIR